MPGLGTLGAGETHIALVKVRPLDLLAVVACFGWQTCRQSHSCNGKSCWWQRHSLESQAPALACGKSLLVGPTEGYAGGEPHDILQAVHGRIGQGIQGVEVSTHGSVAGDHKGTLGLADM